MAAAITRFSTFLITLLGSIFPSWQNSISAAEQRDVVSAATIDERGFRTHAVRSEYQEGPTKIRVLLPDHMGKGERCRVLYVLPVEARDGNRYGDGLLACQRGQIHNDHRLICVAPTFSHLPWYADHPGDPRIRQKTYFIEVVVPFIERSYPVVSEPRGRLLVGFSKSGWGAFSLILRHPEVFGKAAAWDAPLMMERPDKYGSGPIFGNDENFEQYRISKLLKRRAAEFRGEPRLVHLGFGNFREHHEGLRAEMDKLGIAQKYKDGPKRKHDWHSGWLPEAVDMLVE